MEEVVESGLVRVGFMWPLRGCLGVRPSFCRSIGTVVGGSSGSCTTKASIDSARLWTAPPLTPSYLARAVGVAVPPFPLDRFSSFSFASIASLSFLALSFLNLFLSSRRCFVTSSLVSLTSRPLFLFSRSSQLGSLLLRLPFPKKPFSHNARIAISSVT